MVDVKSIKFPIQWVVVICIYVGVQAAALGRLLYKVDKIETAIGEDKAENKEKFKEHDASLTNIRAEAAIHNTRITVLEQTLRR